MRLAIAALMLAGLATCTRTPSAPDRAPATTPPPHARVPQPERGESTIARADYVGPKVCGDCHTDEYDRWSKSLHRVMNARADDPGAVIGNFSGAVVRYAGGEARFTREGSAYVMTLAKAGREVRYTVTRTIGRRGLQEYVGLAAGRTEEVRLPFGWWPRRGGWYPQPYFDPWLGDEAGFDAYAEVTEPWAERCPWCHSTYPFAQRIARASGPRRLGHGLEQHFEAAPAGDRLAVDQQVTTGISCESCHLGGRAHAAGAPIHFVPQGATRTGGPAPTSFAIERRDAAVVNAVCAQCHSGPSPRLADGTALRNSSEALDLAASPCTGIRCTDCHDPHRADARADDARAIAACTHCHTALADPTAARGHAGAGHAATSCLDCHMPRIVMGIDRFVRTHRIASPTNPTLLAEAAPNACNACHLDRSIAWTVDALREGWEVKLDPRRWVHSYPSLDTAVGEAWLASPTPGLRIFAAHAYARSPLGRFALPLVERGLSDPLAYVRAWTAIAVEELRGGKLEGYDPRVR